MSICAGVASYPLLAAPECCARFLEATNPLLAAGTSHLAAGLRPRTLLTRHGRHARQTRLDLTLHAVHQRTDLWSSVL